MTRAETAAFLREHDNYCILTHRRPDGDTIGSSAALCLGLRAMGKTAWLLRNPQFTPRFAAVLEGLVCEDVPDEATIVSVDVAAPDLRYSKIYVSVLEEARQKEAVKGLKSAGGWLRRELGSRLQLRYTPELVFELDDSLKYGAHMFDLLTRLQEKEQKAEDGHDEG